MVTTTSSELFKEKVHVAFLGWEIDRIAKPVLQMKGDRLILICFPRSEEGAWPYLEEIKKELEASGVVVDVIETSLYNLVDLISVLNKVFQVEHAKGNEIYVNVSAGTKISACASTIASMSTDFVVAYYVRTEAYYPKEHMKPPETLTRGVKAIYKLPECKIDTPESRYIKVLHAIQKLGEIEARKGFAPRAYIKPLIEILRDDGLISVKENKDPRKQASSEYMAANALLRPLVSWKFITMCDKKRNKFVEITEDGKNAIAMYYPHGLDAGSVSRDQDLHINDWIARLKGLEG